MKIFGLQKMTLLDFPGKVACTVFLGGCDFRCPYCHNFELVDGTAEPVMEEAELFAFLNKRKGLLDGVAITGGEPCLHRDLPELMRGIRGRGFLVKLDTNGAHPDLLEQILREGLADYVAMDIKNSPEKYLLTAGLAARNAAAGGGAEARSAETGGGAEAGSAETGGGAEARTAAGPLLARIRKSISLLEELAPDYEFRTTVVKEFHEEQDFEEIGKMIAGAKRYFLQAFTDRDTVPFGDLHAPSAEEMQRYESIVRAYVPESRVRGVEGT